VTTTAPPTPRIGTTASRMPRISKLCCGHFEDELLIPLAWTGASTSRDCIADYRHGVGLVRTRDGMPAENECIPHLNDNSHPDDAKILRPADARPLVFA
jgi:hypothetical protein